VFCNFYVFKTPVADAACDVMRRRINHNPGSARPMVITTAACPLFAIKSLTAKNLFSIYTPANHFLIPWSFKMLNCKYYAGELSLAGIKHVSTITQTLSPLGERAG